MSRYCEKHCCWYYDLKCPKCENGEPAHIRSRSEVANPEDWKGYVKKGWTKKW